MTTINSPHLVRITYNLRKRQTKNELKITKFWCFDGGLSFKHSSLTLPSMRLFRQTSKERACLNKPITMKRFFVLLTIVFLRNYNQKTQNIFLKCFYYSHNLRHIYNILHKLQYNFFFQMFFIDFFKRLLWCGKSKFLLWLTFLEIKVI